LTSNEADASREEINSQGQAVPTPTPPSSGNSISNTDIVTDVIIGVFVFVFIAVVGVFAWIRCQKQKMRVHNAKQNLEANLSQVELMTPPTPTPTGAADPQLFRQHLGIPKEGSVRFHITQQEPEAQISITDLTSVPTN
jgi:hypothetical protein